MPGAAQLLTSTRERPVLMESLRSAVTRETSREAEPVLEDQMDSPCESSSDLRPVRSEHRLRKPITEGRKPACCMPLLNAPPPLMEFR